VLRQRLVRAVSLHRDRRAPQSKRALAST
jgi:hypothetical protein